MAWIISYSLPKAFFLSKPLPNLPDITKLTLSSIVTCNWLISGDEVDEFEGFLGISFEESTKEFWSLFFIVEIGWFSLDTLESIFWLFSSTFSLTKASSVEFLSLDVIIEFSSFVSLLLNQ